MLGRGQFKQLTWNKNYPSDISESFVSGSADIALSSNVLQGYRGPRQSGVVHSCTHTRTSFAPIAVRADLSGKPGNYQNLRAHIDAFYAGTLAVSGSSAILASDFDSAIADLIGEIPTDVLLPNLITELPETLTLHKQLRSCFTRATGSWKSAARQYSRQGSNAGLAYAFGIAPFAKDLVSLMNLAGRVRNRIKHLSTISTDDWTPWRRSYSVDKSAVTMTFSPGTFGSSGTMLQSWRVQSDVTADAQIFSRVIRTRTIDPATEMAAGYLDASGMTKVGSAIWEAIPFSFVADWFHPCGRALERLNVSAFEGCLANHMLGYQSHFNATGVVYGIPSNFNSGLAPSTTEVVLGAGTARVYSRSPGLPSTRTEVNFGARQRVLSGMLALQKVKS
jgi:hypothetical protein